MAIGSFNERASQIRFLIVEDNRFGASWIKVLLNQVGVVQVGHAGDGIEAFKEYVYAIENKQPYDAIMMDLILPEQDGYETTLKIREYEEKQSLS